MHTNHSQRRAALSVSQNFLTSGRTIKRIVELARFDSCDHVIEIGPGKGHITRELIKHCGTLTAIELDDNLCKKLSDFYKNNNNIRIIHRDFLRVHLPAVNIYKVFANIPFSITTDIIKKITEAKNPPADAWLVIEKGAAKRFLGIPTESTRSLLIKPFFDSRIVYYFNRTDFHPMPSVETVLVHLHRKEIPDLPYAHRRYFENFIQQCISQPGGWRRLLSKRTADDALRRAGLPLLQTGGEILYIQWLCLFRCTFAQRV